MRTSSFQAMFVCGTLNGLLTATTDAVKVLDAFGKDKVIIEAVGPCRTRWM